MTCAISKPISKRALARYQRFSVMPIGRLKVLAQQALSVANIEGEVAELGSYRGGSTLLLADALPRKAVHAFDSLRGLSNLGPRDRVRPTSGGRGHAMGDFSLGAREARSVRQRLQRRGIIFHAGLFRASRRAAANVHFCFVHFDGDTYRSALECLHFFYPRLSLGGKILLDDYGWPATPGVARALNQFATRQPLTLIQPSKFQIVLVKDSHVRAIH